MKNKFAFLIDILFLGFVVFTISLVLLNFFTPHPYSVIYALCISSLSLIFFYKRQNPKRKGELVKRKEQKELTALMAELNFSDRQQQNSLIEKGLKTAKYSPERRRGVILLKEQSAVILCRFGFTKVSKADVVRAYNLINKEQTAYILAESFDLEVLSFAERFNKKVVLVAGEKIYKFLKFHNCLLKIRCYNAHRQIKGGHSYER